MIGAQTAGAARRRTEGRVGRALPGRPPRSRRPGGDGRRHPPQHRAGRGAGLLVPAAASSSPTRCRPSPTRASTPSANAPRTAASPTAWWRRCSSRARSAPRTWRSSASAATPAARSQTKLKVTGIDLFSRRRLHGRRGHRGDRDERRRGGVYKKLVIRTTSWSAPASTATPVDGSWYFKLIREGRKVADIRDRLMFGESNIGDVGHQGQNRASRWPTPTRSAAATASARARSARPSRTRACSRWTRCASTPRPAPAAAAAPGWSSSS